MNKSQQNIYANNKKSYSKKIYLFIVKVDIPLTKRMFIIVL